MSVSRFRDGQTVGEADGILDAQGRPLTESYVTQAVDDVRTALGRPSLNGDTGKSPQIVVRLPRELRVRAAQVASERGISISALTRDALKNFLGSTG